MSPVTELQTAIDLLLDRFPDTQAIYVFGSVATKQARPDSDLDLAILLPHGRHVAEEILEAKIALENRLNRDVDLIDLRAANTVLASQVIDTGEVIIDAEPDRRREFEMYALVKYARLNEERAPILDEIRDTGRVYAE